MKYFVVLGDGMADLPMEELQGKTPLEFAKTPMMDELAGKSLMGMAKTIPDGMKPGSDTANLAVLGYNPQKYYTGRSPLEALSIGVAMKDSDIAIRTNIITVSETEGLSYEEQTIIDHSSGEISTEDADVLLQACKEVFEDKTYQFYTGTSYRHLLIWNGGEVVDLAQPHDHLEQVLGPYLPTDEKLRDMMKKSYDILNNHPLNLERAAKGLPKANSLWFWGAGTKPSLDSFTEKTGLTGAMISAVDLLKGIAIGAGMKVIEVPGANGGLETNYEGKALAAVKAVCEEGCDFAYVHVEAPDEMGHQGSVEKKIKAIENLDQRVIKVICDEMKNRGEDYRMLIMPDHPTPICIRTHSSDPVPYLIYDSTKERKAIAFYNEKEASATGNMELNGYRLIENLFQ